MLNKFIQVNLLLIFDLSKVVNLSLQSVDLFGV